MAIYRFRISFEDFDEVSREIDIKTNQTFEDLHRAFHRSTGYNADKSSSFYVSTDNWIKGDEIAILPNQRKIDNGVALMEKSKLSNFIEDPHQKFYYIYDFERPFDFHVELIKIILENDPNIEYPYIVKALAKAPKIIDKNNIGSFATGVAAASTDFDFLNEMDFVPEDTEELEAMGGRGIMAEEVDEEEEDEEKDDFADGDDYADEEYGSEKRRLLIEMENVRGMKENGTTEIQQSYNPKTLIVVVGPTAIGKTALAIQLAQFYKTEIISADSRQFFKEMNIGTAKPSQEELVAAPHHFINSHSVKTLFSVGDFEVEALKLLDQLFLRNNVVIMVGGSGLYIDAVCKGLDELPEIDLTIREQLNKQLANDGIESIKTQLQTLDPEYFSKVDQSNPQRMIRGLEVVLSSGQKLSSFLTAQKKERPFNIIKIGLNTERNLLYDRINHRVDLMMDAGLLAEVENLQDYRKYNALNTVGYSELFDFIDDKTDLNSAVAMIKQNTRRFAKRQLTWFRRDENIAWFEPNQVEEIILHTQSKIVNLKP